MGNSSTNGNQTKFAPGNKLGNRFKKGESGNPAGRPAGSKNVTTVLRELMQQLAPDEIVDAKFVKEFCKGKKGVTNAEAIAARLLKAAIIDGEGWAIKEISDRIEGKPRQSFDVDLSVADWRQMAEDAGLTEDDVIDEIKPLLTR